MSSAKKNNEWHFGMKMHIGADAKHGAVHSMVVTSAKVSDEMLLPICCMERKSLFLPTRVITAIKISILREMRAFILELWKNEKLATVNYQNGKKKEITVIAPSARKLNMFFES